MKRTFKTLLAAAALAFVGLGSLLTANPAHAVPTCTSVASGGVTTYPYGGHAFVCFADLQNHKKTVFDAVAGLGQPLTKLQQTGTKFFFFRTRADAVDYFNNTAPYNLLPFGHFAAPTTRCGNTGYAVLGPIVHNVSIIYDECTLDQTPGVPPSQIANPMLKRTAIHETGHAYDNAIGFLSGTPNNVPSLRAGFQALLSRDIGLLTPSNWSGPVGSTPQMTQSQRYNYMCGLFSIGRPSDLERDFGATLNGGPLGRVCETVSLPYPYFQTKTPTQAAQEKLPYFLTARELWAEAFLITFDGSSVPSSSGLQMTDRVIGMNQAPVRSFNCTRRVVQAYAVNGTPPSTTELSLIGCPTNPGPL